MYKKNYKYNNYKQITGEMFELLRSSILHFKLVFNCIKYLIINLIFKLCSAKIQNLALTKVEGGGLNDTAILNEYFVKISRFQL